MKHLSILVLILCLGFNGCDSITQTKQSVEKPFIWDEILEQQVQLLGHQNWHVVVDTAYTLQSSPGITTILSNKNHFETIKKSMPILNNQQHIKPNIFLDQEIDYVAENQVNRIGEFRDSL